MLRIGVIIPAAGASARYQTAGGVRSKLDEDLGGKSVLQRSVELFSKAQSPDWEIATVVVAGPYEEAAFEDFKLRHGDKLGFLGVRLCRGGRLHRYESVRAAIGEIPTDCTHIAVHDAARPCGPIDFIERLLDAAVHHNAVVPAVEVVDTLKKITEIDDDSAPDPLAAILGEDASRESRVLKIVERTLDRRRVWAVQTPQVFAADLLRRAYEQDDIASTDDASLVERLGERVVVIPGDVRNIKITRPGDVQVARAIMGCRPPEERPVHKRF